MAMHGRHSAHTLPCAGANVLSRPHPHPRATRALRFTLGALALSTVALCTVALRSVEAAEQPAAATTVAAASTASQPFDLTGWKVQLSGETANTAHRCFATFRLVNQTNAALKNVVVTLEVRPTAAAEKGALVQSEPKAIAALKAGESCEVVVSATEIAANGEFLVRVAYPADGRTKQVCFGGGSRESAPSFTADAAVAPATEGATVAVSNTAALPSATLAPAAAALTELTAGSWKVETPKDSADAILIGKITNRTGEIAKKVKVTVTLTKKAADGSVSEVASVVVPSENPILPGSSVELRGKITECPAFDGMTATVDYERPEAARSPALGTARADLKADWTKDMAGGAQVEMGFNDDAELDAKGSVIFKGKLRNGTKHDVDLESIQLTFSLPNGNVKKVTVALPGRIAAGTLCSVNLVVPGIGDFDRYTYQLNFRR